MNNISPMKICVLLPDYSTTKVDYQHYDPMRNLSALMPHCTVDHVLLNKLTVHRQLKELKKGCYDIFVNLCEGYLDWEVPSIDVIYSLDLLNLPYTGPNQLLYDPSKELMKYVAYTQGVATPGYTLIESAESALQACNRLRYPLFVKPSHAGDSLGINDRSLVKNSEELYSQCKELVEEYGTLMVEEYIDGREFTVMVVRKAGSKDEVIVFRPVEYIFPEGKKFKTYALKTSELHADANIAVPDGALCEQLKKSAADIFNAFGGVGYARLDFRMDERGVLYFLEINFTCSVFYSDGFEGSADHILAIDGRGPGFFLEKIIEEGIERHKKKQKKYVVKGDAISGYGIYAVSDIEKGAVVFSGEGRSQRLITKSYVDEHWNEQDRRDFARYAYPVCDGVYLLWDEHAAEWAPQNHSCDANTAYKGLDVVANRNINKGEELTLDYSDFLNEEMEGFLCNCGNSNCKGTITGVKGNSVAYRLKNMRP